MARREPLVTPAVLEITFESSIPPSGGSPGLATFCDAAITGGSSCSAIPRGNLLEVIQHPKNFASMAEIGERILEKAER